MFSKVWKVVLPTAPMLLAATPVVSSNDSSLPSTEEKKIRRSELPIYPKEECECKKAPMVFKEESNVVLEGISLVRQEIQGLFGQSGDLVNKSVYVINTGIAHTGAQIDFLRDEDNVVARVGAIAGGSLFGLLISIRKGFFKKLFYGMAGGLAMASVCYPNEADKYSQVALSEAKKYALVGYHFLNGVSKDLIGVELPELPKPAESAAPVSEVKPTSVKTASFQMPSPPLENPKPKA